MSDEDNYLSHYSLDIDVTRTKADFDGGTCRICETVIDETVYLLRVRFGCYEQVACPECLHELAAAIQRCVPQRPRSLNVREQSKKELGWKLRKRERGNQWPDDWPMTRRTRKLMVLPPFPTLEPEEDEG